MTLLSIIMAMVLLSLLMQAGNHFITRSLAQTERLAQQLQKHSREITI